MNRDDIIRMAEQAGVHEGGEANWVEGNRWELFANLVAAAERNRTWTQDHWTEYERSIAAAEREACAKVADHYDVADDVALSDTAEGIAIAIRARGQV